MTTSSITDGQKKQYKRFIEDAAERALDEANISKDGLQRLIAKGGEFQEHILAGIKEFSGGEGYTRYVESKPSGYAAGYKPIPITEQIYRLNELFEKAYLTSFVSQPLPEGAEHWFVIPRWELFAPTYQEALKMLFDRMKSTRCFAPQVELERIRQHPRSVEMMARVVRQQFTPNAFIIPAQFGLRHKSQPMRDVRARCEGSNEFPLGMFATGMMLLTHPERLREFANLSIDCPGDEISSGLTSEWDRAPCFSCDDSLGAGARDIDESDDFGSVTGFLPWTMTNPTNLPRDE